MANQTSIVGSWLMESTQSTGLMVNRCHAISAISLMKIIQKMTKMLKCHMRNSCTVLINRTLTIEDKHKLQNVWCRIHLWIHEYTNSDERTLVIINKRHKIQIHPHAHFELFHKKHVADIQSCFIPYRCKHLIIMIILACNVINTHQ